MYLIAILALLSSAAPLAGASGTPEEAVALVQLDTLAQVDQLQAEGFNVTNRRGMVVSIYSSAGDLERLAALGYQYELVPPAPRPSPKADEPGYHSYESMTLALHSYADAYPGLCRLYTLGQSVQGRELWALQVAADPDAPADRPQFKYVSTMHGDEAIGTQLCMYLIDRLLSDYGTDPRITALVNDTDIWIVPLMNPDGYEWPSGWRRVNARGVDLNRNFPQWPAQFDGTIFDGAPLRLEGREPETAAVMAWSAANSFVLSANFHSGALVVNYPYDDDGKPTGTNAATPDDALFRHLARRYAMHNPPMWASPMFPNGITNGTAWYTISGGMQDWNYRYLGCLEVTIELSDTKAPPPAQLPQLWEDNEESMLAYMEAVHMGVRGLVTDQTTGGPVYASVRVDANPQPVFTNPLVGNYHRLLLPGAYRLTFSAPGYLNLSVDGVVVSEGAATRVDIVLIPGTVDVNGDGEVDAVDVQLVINSTLGLDTAFDTDVNGDGAVNAVDIQLVINAVLGV